VEEREGEGSRNRVREEKKEEGIEDEEVKGTSLSRTFLSLGFLQMVLRSSCRDSSRILKPVGVHRIQRRFYYDILGKRREERWERDRLRLSNLVR
jgi:hypothetical protein